MDNAPEPPGDPTGHPSLETTVIAPVVGLDPDPAIEQYVQGFDAVGRDVAALIAALSEAQLNWRPGDGRWSIAECVAHLTATGTLYLAPLERAIERGHARAMFGGREFQPSAIGRWFIAQMEPPPRRKMKAPRKIAPQRFESARALSEGFDRMHRELIDRVRRSASLDLSRVKLGSPIVPLLRMPLGTWFGFILAHERRHLWQARQVRQELRFPG
jgi:hypothetical protein